TARKLADTMELFNGALFHEPGVRVTETPELLIVSSAQIRCEVDRRTLVPRRYLLLDDSGAARFTMELSDYRMIGEIPFAYGYLAISDDGRILIALREVELNGALAENAFVPPRRAEKLP